eukprot:Gregarina_sp_Poly_1__826@NODE_1198_length_4803_cov_95_037162_g823_i0_p4_GENE_NODE_1198_length_4803_cov_95_037162_g823_i0NODE_1198_length_4803_cov_95_037162_g823_i0_p4_ORF_typecomplete_len179_score21_85_NODE_1198_length_4803_cov_95_037162_g823_i038734409
MASLGAWPCLLLSVNGVFVLTFWGHLLASRSGAIVLSSPLKERHAASACYIAALLYLVTGAFSIWKVVSGARKQKPTDDGFQNQSFRRRKRRWTDIPSSRYRKSIAAETEPLLFPAKTHSVRVMSPAEFGGFVSQPGPHLHLSQFKSSFSSEFTPPPSARHDSAMQQPHRLSRVTEGA